MSLEDVKELLETLEEYRNSLITHSFIENGNPIVSVCYLVKSSSFQLTYFDRKNIEKYDNKEAASLAVHKRINDK